MKKIFVILCILSKSLSAQDKFDQIRYERLIEVEGTPYIIAKDESYSKMETLKKMSILFINTNSGGSVKVDLPFNGYINHIYQIKIDELSINKILVSARISGMNKLGTYSLDSEQIIILSVDGKEQIQLTPDKFIVSTWQINKTSGTITVNGFDDTNENGKLDKKDKPQILIFDLKTLKLTHKVF